MNAVDIDRGSQNGVSSSEYKTDLKSVGLLGLNLGGKVWCINSLCWKFTSENMCWKGELPEKKEGRQ